MTDIQQSKKPSANQTLTVLVENTEEARRIGERWPDHVDVCFLDTCRPEKLSLSNKVFVVTSATRLRHVAPCVSKASHANRLQALLVLADVTPEWVPLMFEQAQLRVLRNTLVHRSEDLPSRIITAWAYGEQHDTIADAAVIGSDLFVRSCALELHRIDFDAYPALQRIRREDRSHFEIDEDGIFLFWPGADVHLDLEAIRTANSPALRERLRARQLAESEAFGQAVRALREKLRLSQAEVTRRSGLSERHIRRIENGTAPGEEALDALALAHDMEPNDYLNAISELLPQVGEQPWEGRRARSSTQAEEIPATRRQTTKGESSTYSGALRNALGLTSRESNSRASGLTDFEQFLFSERNATDASIARLYSPEMANSHSNTQSDNPTISASTPTSHTPSRAA